MSNAEGIPRQEDDSLAELIFLNGAIRVVRRPDDYMAFVDGDTALWGRGTSADEAIGALVRTHPHEIVESLQPEQTQE